MSRPALRLGWALLALLVALLPGLLLAAPAQAASVSVLYKRDSETSLPRLDPAAQAVLQSMEEKLIDSGLTVIQPDAKLYALLDQARGVVLNFSAEAGLTMTLDVSKGQRPNPGADSTWAEVRLRAKIYSGTRILASSSAFGAVAFRGQAQERAFEAAAKRAVDDIAAKLLARLDAEPPAPPAPAPSLVVPPSEPAPPPSAVQPARGVKWALMVGVSDFTHAQGGESGHNNLDGVTRDMQTVRAALADLGVERQRLLWLYNAEATTAGVRAALAQLQAQTAPEDLVYVYLSTHGLPKADGLSRFGIPVTYDFRKDNFIDFEQFRTALAAMPAGNIIWLNDTCHSGLAAEGLVTVEVGARDFSVAPPAAFDVSKAASVQAKNIAVISSASGEQKAVDLGPGGGLFSSIFVQGVARIVQAKQAPPSIYGFFKSHVDGKVQAGFHDMCSTAPLPGFCSQGTQQPVFGAQRDGKLIGM